MQTGSRQLCRCSLGAGPCLPAPDCCQVRPTPMFRSGASCPQISVFACE